MDQEIGESRQSGALDEADALEALLARLDVAARQPLPPEEFYGRVLDDLGAGIPILSAAVWTETSAGLETLLTRQSGTSRLEQLTPANERQMAIAVIDADEPKLIPPQGSLAGTDVTNQSTALQCWVARRSDGLPAILLRVSLKANATLEQRETAAGLLSAIADIAVIFQLQHRVRQLQRSDAFWQELDHAIAAMHSTTKLKRCGQVISEQVRHLLRADRVSVLTRHGRRCRLVAISSAATLDRRSRQARLLEKLAADVVTTNEGLSAVVGGRRSVAHEAGQRLDHYLDETQVRALRAIPLREGGGATSAGSAVRGVLIVEQFTADGVDEWESRLGTLAPHAGQALSLAVGESHRGWRRFVWPFESLGRGMMWLTLMGLLIAACVALTVIQIDFTVKAEGQLMPVSRRGVFAPSDAIVTEILIDDHAIVKAGTPLLHLIDPDLEQEFSRLRGEQQTGTANLAAVQARKRLKLRDKSIDTSALSIEEEEIKAQLAGLEQQLAVITEQRERLLVTSPLAGEVVRWDLREVLQGLPVRHGQHLLDVYDSSKQAPWRVELRIPDDVAGYVRDANFEAESAVEFVFQTDATRHYRGTLAQLADATELDSAGELTVRGYVPVPAGLVNDPRRGATVVARIHCGQRSVGFVWFREVVEFVYRNVLF
ncbi:MAG: hypothetical protein R3B90_08940 [Planctomycetaceae bacterium]